jgi:hypothetical protein
MPAPKGHLSPKPRSASKQRSSDEVLPAPLSKKLSQAGRALLVLEQHGKIDLDDPRAFPGPTGARALSSVLAAAAATFDVSQRILQANAALGGAELRRVTKRVLA